MKDYDRYSKCVYLLPIGIIMLLPSFILSFVQQGNNIDKAFFFFAVLGYIFIIVATVLGYKKQHPKDK